MAMRQFSLARSIRSLSVKAWLPPNSLLQSRYHGRAFGSSRQLLESQPSSNSQSQHASGGSTNKPFDASASSSTSAFSKASKVSKAASNSPITAPPDWEENPDFNISRFSELPHSNFGVNQHMVINDEFKEALRQILWKFRAPIRYAFAYGSGVFPQSTGGSADSPSIHPNAPLAVQKAQDGNPKMIDFIFGVSYSQHWHSLNLGEHRDHYSALGSLGSYAVSKIQDSWGAGVYFHPYVTVNGTLIKYGVVNLDTLCKDLSEWSTMYLAGRLQKPVKILRDDPRVRLANQVNLISALRTALILLPESFTEHELYGTIASLSYLGDPRMALPTEDPSKIANIVGHNLPNFRRLYAPLIENLPNVDFNDPKCSKSDWSEDPTANVRLEQDMDPVKRGNMVRRLPKAFRGKLYFQYQKKYQIPRGEFDEMMEKSSDEDATRIHRRQGGGFEQRIAQEPVEDLRNEIRGVIKKTIGWTSTSQSLKGPFTAGFARSWRYVTEKMEKNRLGKLKAKEKAEEAKREEKEKAEAEKETNEEDGKRES